jgi:hypothetical protein
VWLRGQNSGAVARVGLATTTTAVVHTMQHRQSVFDDLVGPLPLDVSDEANATVFVLPLRIVELWNRLTPINMTTHSTQTVWLI